MLQVLLACALAAAAATGAAAAGRRVATATWDPQTTQVKLLTGVYDPQLPNAVAYGVFDDTLDETGWGTLTIHTTGHGDDLAQMYGAGLIEGWTTRERIYQQYTTMSDFFWPKGKSVSPKVLEFFKTQRTWTESMIEKHAYSGNGKLAETWGGIALIRQQFGGLADGYNMGANASSSASAPSLPLFAFEMLNGVGDLLTIMPALEDQLPDFEKMNSEEFFRYTGTHGMCSGFIKLKYDMSDLFVGHSSWFTFASTNRIFKHYRFGGLQAPWVAGHSVSFSSYPGYLESLDDFYQSSSGLAMVQTTNSIFNNSLYAEVSPYSLLEWQRVRLAMMNAHNGEEWSELISNYNMGTYPNQFMVVDMKRFTKGVGVAPGTLTVCEQIPGLTKCGDATEVLERSYWSSYNIPYWTEIYDRSGYPAQVAKHGPRASYQMAPRAQIFRRIAHTAHDIETFRAVLRYNDYKNDPVSQGDPGAAICSRFDLESTNPMPFGCYDTKVMNLELFNRLEAWAINGPTRSHNIPAFSWKEQGGIFNGTVHAGTPEIYQFKFEKMAAARP